MKFNLLCILLFLVTACTGSGIKLAQQKDIRFHAGEKIYVHTGFYKTCGGYIINHSPYLSEEGKVAYGVRLTCNTIEMGSEVFLLEDEFVEDMSQQ